MIITTEKREKDGIRYWLEPRYATNFRTGKQQLTQYEARYEAISESVSSRFDGVFYGCSTYQSHNEDGDYVPPATHSEISEGVWNRIVKSLSGYEVVAKIVAYEYDPQEVEGCQVFIISGDHDGGEDADILLIMKDGRIKYVDHLVTSDVIFPDDYDEEPYYEILKHTMWMFRD